MKKLTTLFAIAALTATAGIAQARDLGPDEALKLRDAGTIQNIAAEAHGIVGISADVAIDVEWKK